MGRFQMGLNSFMTKLHYPVKICGVKNDTNPTKKAQNMGSGSFQNALFGNATFAYGSYGYICLWAQWFTIRIKFLPNIGKLDV